MKGLVDWRLPAVVRRRHSIDHTPVTPSRRVSDYGPRKQRLGINYTAPAAAVSAMWMTHRGSIAGTTSKRMPRN